jgi:hypothetical protein
MRLGTPPTPRLFLYVWQDKKIAGRENVSVAGIGVSERTGRWMEQLLSWEVAFTYKL